MIIFFYGDAGEFFGVSMFYPSSSYAVGIIFFFILDRYIPRAYGIVMIFLSDSAYVTWSQIHACRLHGNLMSDPGNHNDTTLFPRSSMVNIFKSSFPGGFSFDFKCVIVKSLAGLKFRGISSDVTERSMVRAPYWL